MFDLSGRVLRLTIVAGARPNFIKVASLFEACRAHPFWQKTLFVDFVHTGQHHDSVLSGSFLDELNLPPPDLNLGCGSGSHAEQTGKIMVGFENYLNSRRTDCVLVVGDVNSTLACAIVAAKGGVPVAHVEAGLESGDRTMPEEINRLATDAVADFFFCTSQFAVENLRRRGHAEDNIFLVGNTMVDTLKRNLPRARPPGAWAESELMPSGYGVLTLHRPANVDDPERLAEFIAGLDAITHQRLVFPVHPRTRKILAGLKVPTRNLLYFPPSSYLEFLYLLSNCSFVLTDSGGIQEETTYLGKPCITLRENTERPETVSVGTNVLVGNRLDLVAESLQRIQRGEWKASGIPYLWDGDTGERILAVLLRCGFMPH